jgi:hypothetical protein
MRMLLLGIIIWPIFIAIPFFSGASLTGYIVLSAIWWVIALLMPLGVVQDTPSKIRIDSDSISGWVKEGIADRKEIMKTTPFSAIADINMTGWWGPTTVTNANLWTVGVMGQKNTSQPFTLTRENALRVKEAWEAWKKRQVKTLTPEGRVALSDVGGQGGRVGSTSP